MAIAQGRVCFTAFVNSQVAKEQVVAAVRKHWPTALLREDVTATAVVARMLLEPAAAHTVPLAIYGTSFQRAVWTAVQAIPYGKVVSYQAVAQQIGRPTAVRAVARAIGSNKLAVAIPCHRVVMKNGDLCGFRWGLPVKRALLAREGVTIP